MLNANLSSSNSVEELTVEQYLTQQCDLLIKVRVSQRNQFFNKNHIILNISSIFVSISPNHTTDEFLILSHYFSGLSKTQREFDF
jgi:hypothetical protein